MVYQQNEQHFHDEPTQNGTPVLCQLGIDSKYIMLRMSTSSGVITKKKQVGIRLPILD